MNQRLSLWESWREAPERARMLKETHGRCDSIALTKELLIAVRRLCHRRLALSVTFGDTSPMGRGTGVPGDFHLTAESSIWHKI